MLKTLVDSGSENDFYNTLLKKIAKRSKHSNVSNLTSAYSMEKGTIKSESSFRTSLYKKNKIRESRVFELVKFSTPVQRKCTECNGCHEKCKMRNVIDHYDTLILRKARDEENISFFDFVVKNKAAFLQMCLIVSQKVNVDVVLNSNSNCKKCGGNHLFNSFLNLINDKELFNDELEGYFDFLLIALYQNSYEYFYELKPENEKIRSLVKKNSFTLKGLFSCFSDENINSNYKKLQRGSEKFIEKCSNEFNDMDLT